MALLTRCKRFLGCLSAMAILLVTFESPGVADSLIRTKAIEDRQSERVNLYREKFGTSDGRLANALQEMWTWYAVKDFASKSQPLIDEWLEVYPLVPAKDQRYCAGSALQFASSLRTYRSRHFDQPSPEQINKSNVGAKIALCVLKSINFSSEDWTPDKNLKRELNIVENSFFYTEDFKELARKALLQQMRPEVAKANELVTELKEIYENPKTLHSKKKISDAFESLTAIFPNLREMDRRDLAGEILNITALAIRGDQKILAEKLLWKVFENIDPAWMEHGEVSAGLLENSSYYFQTEKNFDSVAKLIEKANAFNDFDGSGQSSRGEFHMILGDTYLLLERKKDAKREFETALKIENSYLNSGLYDGYSEGADLTKTRIIERLQKLK